VDRHDVRLAVQQGGQMAGQVGVPGVRVHDVAVARGRGDAQVHAQRLKCLVRMRELGIGGVRVRIGPRTAEAVDVDVCQPAQLTGEVLDVHTRAAVHLGWPLACQQPDAHGLHRSAATLAP
jgi:hypothetical protein